MIDVQTASLAEGIIHYTGNRNAAEPFVLSGKPLALEIETSEQLLSGFLSRFKGMEEQYRFHHPSSLQYHNVYQQCRGILTGNMPFEEASAALARQLYEASMHPKIKGGELYITRLQGIAVNSRMHTAVGIFKTETKALFLEVRQEKEGLELDMREGTELTRIDKGCLVLNAGDDDGYQVLLFDNQSRGEEALYWKEGFLGLAPRENEFHHTAHILTLTKQFITAQGEEALPKKEQVELLKRSIDYFRGHDNFEINEFQSEVFGNEDMIASFREYGSRYVQSNDYDIAESFDISPEAVKKQARIYKSVLKLDRNFHIYIHGRTDLIERGTEADGRKFYKIYYQDES